MDFVLIRESFKSFKLTESYVWLIHNADLEKGQHSPDILEKRIKETHSNTSMDQLMIHK